MKKTTDFIAVDLGASGGRLMVGEWNGQKFSLRALHRFSNHGVRVGGSLHWDVPRIWAEIVDGLRLYGSERTSPPASIGVDSWGVDFGLLDGHGQMIGTPYHYRDSRTDGMPQRFFEAIGEADVFAQTGVQTMQINTLFQMYSMVRDGDAALHSGSTLQMIPDLFSHFLDGGKFTESSIASTTQMYNPRERVWCSDLLRVLQVPESLFPPVLPAGSVRGHVLGEVLRNAGLGQTFPVVAVASHDTASAVAAIPNLDERSVFISSGTWSVMGIELDEPITTAEALASGFTNEIGAGGSILFMKNITGLWILQECVRCWSQGGSACDWADVIAAAEQARPWQSFIDPNAGDFLAPVDMPEAIRRYCLSTGQRVPETVGDIARCCFESLALKYRTVIRALESLTARKIDTVRIVGGGCLNTFLCQLSADASNCRVIGGPVEASALGNVMVQAIATEHLPSILSGRLALADSTEFDVYEPRSGDGWLEAAERFERLEVR